MTEANLQADEALYSQLCGTLSAASVAAIGPWVEAAVSQRVGSSRLESEASAAAAVATEVVGEELRSFLELASDQQRGNPLAILRKVVPYATDVLATAGVPAVGRDRQAVELHPDDPYDLTPGAFSDFGDAVHEAGIRWGAGKAHLHLARHRKQTTKAETS